MTTRLEAKAEGRRCRDCGKALSIYILLDRCFSCQVVHVKGYDTKRHKPRKEIADPNLVIKKSLCTSRETRGFNIAYRDYYGCSPD